MYLPGQFWCIPSPPPSPPWVMCVHFAVLNYANRKLHIIIPRDLPVFKVWSSLLLAFLGSVHKSLHLIFADLISHYRLSHQTLSTPSCGQDTHKHTCFPLQHTLPTTNYLSLSLSIYPCFFLIFWFLSILAGCQPGCFHRQPNHTPSPSLPPTSGLLPPLGSECVFSATGVPPWSSGGHAASL